MTPDPLPSERTEYRVARGDGKPVAASCGGEPTPNRKYAEEHREWMERNGNCPPYSVQRRTVTATPWEDVTDA